MSCFYIKKKVILVSGNINQIMIDVRCYDTDVTTEPPRNINCIGSGIMITNYLEYHDTCMLLQIHYIYSKYAITYAQGFHYVSSPPPAWKPPRDGARGFFCLKKFLHHPAPDRNIRTVDGWYILHHSCDSVQQSIDRHAVLSLCFFLDGVCNFPSCGDTGKETPW